MTFLQPHAHQPWIEKASHQLWLEAEGQRLLDFYTSSKTAAIGFSALDDNGQKSTNPQTDTMLTARMTHCYALAAMRGLPGAMPLAQHGVKALSTVLKDHQYGGWCNPADPASAFPKQAYIHSFVALAGSSAMLADVDGSAELLADIVDIISQHFWSEQEGAMREAFSQDWQREEPYRGGNSNMHATEACLALADALDQPVWLERALAIVTRVIHHHARKNGYRIIEHFDQDWNPLPDYNHARPADPFRPYGATPGHALEWSRLLLQLEASLERNGMVAPDWLVEDAKGLFHTALELGWNVDGHAGLIYTHDWDNRPIIHQRMHWTLAEAIGAAASLSMRTHESVYEDWYRQFWDYSAEWLIDTQAGSWRHELDASNQPAATVWVGKPDLYHAYQATLIPRLPLTPSMACAIKGNLWVGR